MSAQELRKAAETLRERAVDASRAVDGVPVRWYEEGHLAEALADAFGHESRDAYDRDAAYIATMHPGVGLALADWLEATTCGLHCDADGKREPYCSACEDSGYDHDCPPRRECDHTVGFRHALTLARLINGGA